MVSLSKHGCPTKDLGHDGQGMAKYSSLSFPLVGNHSEEGSRTSRHDGQENDQVLKKLLKLLVGKAGILDDRSQGIRIQSFMVWNRYAMSAVGHADMLAPGHYSESGLAECPYRSFGRDISEKHFRRGPLLRRPRNLLSLPLSCGGMC